jgi:hypothetical protein
MNMRKLINLIEAPLADITTHGNPLDDEGSFSQNDRAHIQKSIRKQVYKKKLANVPFNLYIYVVNIPGLDRFGEKFPEGRLDKSLLQKMAKFSPQAAESIQDLQTDIDDNLFSDPTSIHFVMGDNFSDDDQFPPTSWIMIHRLVHAMSQGGDKLPVRDINYFVQQNHEKYSNAKDCPWNIQDILTMRSAVSKRLDSSEVNIEMATQYFLTGDVGLRNMQYFDQNGQRELGELIAGFKEDADLMVKSCQGAVFYI